MLQAINEHHALIYTMVIVSAADGDMSDAELDEIGRIVRFYPVFRGFDLNALSAVGEDCAELLRQEEGFDLAINLITDALSPRLRETAYALACEVATSDLTLGQHELRVLEMFRNAFGLDRLVSAAIERGARARHATL